MGNCIKTQSGIVKFNIVRKNIKSIRLRVTSESQIEVSAPYHVRESTIVRFVQDNSDFVAGRLAEMEYRRACSYPEDYKDGDMFSLLGIRTLLRVEKGGRNSADLIGSVLTIKTPNPADREACRQAFIAWAKRHAKKVFSERLAVLQPTFEKLRDKNIRISVRDMKTRWGSINIRKDTMSLSVHLLRCELELVDHIIIHELCHYKHADHSRAFYEELSKHSPGYKQLQKRLKEYGMVGF